MRSERAHVAIAAAAGVGYILTGVALLLQELGVAAVSWSFVVPLVLLVTGIALLTTAGPGRDGTGVAQASREPGEDSGGRAQT